ncbi:hypothetical protein ACFL4L_02135 [bacterium]
MNIRKYMKEHEAYINEQFLKKAEPQNWNVLKETHAKMIQYMQHERLIHLLVTLAIALFLLLTMVIVIIKPYLQIFILMGLFFILLVPYITHYYFLENTIQHWYKLMDEIEKIINSRSEKRNQI